MTEIDFYILDTTEDDARVSFLCRLCEKIIAKGKRVMIWLETEEQGRALSDALWCARPESFLAHEFVSQTRTLAQRDTAPCAKIVLSQGVNIESEHDVLINLCHSVPKLFSRFDRLVEIVYQNQEALAQSRERYRYYHSRGYLIRPHEIAC